MLALIAGTVSYLHMHPLVALHGQPGWVAALTPLSVDGMIAAASTTLLANSRSSRIAVGPSAGQARFRVHGDDLGAASGDHVRKLPERRIAAPERFLDGLRIGALAAGMDDPAAHLQLTLDARLVTVARALALLPAHHALPCTMCWLLTSRRRSQVFDL